MLLIQSQTSLHNKQVSTLLRLLALDINTRVKTCTWPNQAADEMEL